MKLTFLGANQQVTGSCYHLEAAGKRILIDCGLFQERQYVCRNWDEFPMDLKNIDCMLLTHAHLDHSGRIPRIYKQGFRATIYTTQPSIELTGLILRDSAKIQEEDAEFKKARHVRECRNGPFPVQPLYTAEETEDALKLLRPVEYNKPFQVVPGVTATYHDAGHILGSAIVEVNIVENGKKHCVIFSGDLGQWHKPLVRDPSLLDRADYVVLESTYGDREHDHSVPVEDTLAEVINDTFKRGGNLVIPTFAVERAQELLYHFGNLQRAKKIPRVMVFLDSPMAVDATEMFKRYRNLLDDQVQKTLALNNDPLHFPGLQLCKTRQQSQAINNIKGTAIILAGAGMCTGGRIKHHLVANITRPQSTVLFCGYQSPGTLGRQILDGDAEVRIHGKFFPVHAAIKQVQGFSAHADRNDLMRWVMNFERPIKRIFLTHGEFNAATALASQIKSRGDFNVHIPEYRETVEWV